MLGISWWLGAIDEVARSRGDIGGDLLGMAGRDIFLQASQKPDDFHTGRGFADPEVRAGLQFLHVSLDTKPRMLHEVGR